MVYLGISAGNRNSVDLESNGPSNGHSNDLNRSNDPESSGDEEREGQIRVGKDYQINPPPWIPPARKLISMSFWSHFYPTLTIFVYRT